MTPIHTSSSRRVARHTGLNLLGLGLPALVGLATVPVLVHGLGKEAYGAFSLAWALLGYFSLVDLGLGRATTRFVAEYVARGDHVSLRHLVRTSILTQISLGLAGTVVLALLVPWLVTHVFRVPANLAASVSTGFYLLAATLPVLLVTANLMGVLEGLRSFGVLNAVRIPASLAVLVFPAIAVGLGGDFLAAMIAVVAARLLGVLLLALVVHRALPGSGEAAGNRDGLVRGLLAFGGWITVSNVVSPMMVYFDRFVIGSRVDLAAVSYYSAPYDVVTRLLLLPSSLVSVLFPEFSALSVSDDRRAAERLFLLSARTLLAGLGLVLVALMPMIHAGLDLWLGPDFATAASWPTRLLLIGILVNGLAWIPYAYLQGGGRPDLPAKAHLLELPLYLALLWALTGAWGITGTATAWLVRVSLDGLLLFTLVVRQRATSTGALLRRLGPGLLLVGAAAASGSLLAGAASGWLGAAGGAALGTLVYCTGGWLLLDQAERQLLLGLLSRLQKRVASRHAS